MRPRIGYATKLPMKELVKKRMQTAKSILKRYAPLPLLKVAKSANKTWVARTVNRYDRSNFGNSRFRSFRRARLEQLEGKLIFHAHSLEKGLSHADIRFNFGRAALEALVDTLRSYQAKDLPRERLPYLNALSTLRAYNECHIEANVDTSTFQSILGPDLLREVLLCESDIGGATQLDLKTADRKKQMGFADLFLSRSSVREFSPEPVLPGRIRPAIKLALHAPSVCNRQSARVKVITDISIIKRLLQIQGGMTGYDSPPALLAVTSDLSSFMDPTERNQPFVDGGLFAMGLLLALEHEHLAACPLNAMMTVAQEESVRNILNLPRTERLILFIAVGEFIPNTRLPKSFRYEVEDISTHH